MSNTNDRAYWIKSTLFTLMQRFSVQLFALGSVPFLFRGLSENDMGAWVIFLSTISLLEVGRMGLLQNALVKFLTTVLPEGFDIKTMALPEEYKKIATASLVLNGLVTVFIVLLLLIGGPILAHIFNKPELTALFHIYMATTVLLMPFMQSNYIGQANLDFKGMFWGDFTKQGLLFAFILFLYFSSFELNIIYLALFQIVTAIAGSIATCYVNRHFLHFTSTIDWSWVKKLFAFGKFVLATNLSTMLYKSIDKWMLGGLVSLPAAAAYEAAIKVTNLVEVPTHAMANVLFPQSARKMSEGPAAVKRLYEKTVGAILAMLIPAIILVLLFADIIIWIIAGDKYLDSAYLLRWTILYGLFIPFAIQFGTVLDSIGKPKINFTFTLISALLNVVLNYVFITNFGIVGAAWGTLLTYAITFIMMQYVLHKLLKVNALNAFKHSVDFYSEAWNKGKKMLFKPSFKDKVLDDNEFQ